MRVLISKQTQGNEETHDIRSRSHTPILIAALGQSLHDICLVAHEPEETHDFLSACADAAEPD